MDKTDLLIELCRNKANDVKVVIKVNDNLIETEITNVIYDEKTKCFKLITK